MDVSFELTRYFFRRQRYTFSLVFFQEKQINKKMKVWWGYFRENTYFCT